MAVVYSARKPHTYRDSVILMELSHALSTQPGIREAAVLMGTPANLQVLHHSGLLPPDERDTAPDDILIAVKAMDEASAKRAVEWALTRLDTPPASDHRVVVTGSASGAVSPYRGWRHLPETARLALISTPGEYAASEAWKALRAGLHVFLFSDHVAIEDEIVLKQAGWERGLLVMGPECGTSIINGVPLGFANQVRSGPIGIVAASGSGLQEMTCLIDQFGSGISHAIGTGSRDLSPAVGGRTMLQGIDLLLHDDKTEILILLSKPPSIAVAQRILTAIESSDKPVIVCFLGMESLPVSAAHIHLARTLEQAARLAVELVTGEAPPAMADPEVSVPCYKSAVLRGLFTGGTLAYEALIILEDRVGAVWSNKPLNSAYQLVLEYPVDEHICLDMGAEEYTLGRPHPMIDPTTRARLLVEMAQQVEAGVFLLDFVLGYGSHPDPVSAMLPAVCQAQEAARIDGRDLVFVASVTGTNADLQPREIQVRKLTQHGVIVAPSNASAVRTAARLLNNGQ